MITVLVIIALLIVNGFFVAAEFAIVGAPRASLENLAEKGNRRARRVVAILDNVRRRDRFIATTQIGVSLASLGLGMYGEHTVAEWRTLLDHAGLRVTEEARFVTPLETEPWLFAINRQGKVAAVLEGAFDAGEVTKAAQAAMKG